MKLLTPNELEYVREQGAQGRRQLAETFQLSKSYHITLTKESLLFKRGSFLFLLLK